jgi:hypothetical protein
MSDDRLVSDEDAMQIEANASSFLNMRSPQRWMAESVTKLLRDREARIEMYGQMAEQARVIPLLKGSIIKANARIAVLREALEHEVEEGESGVSAQSAKALDQTDEAAEALLALVDTVKKYCAEQGFRLGLPQDVFKALERYDKATGVRNAM